MYAVKKTRNLVQRHMLNLPVTELTVNTRRMLRLFMAYLQVEGGECLVQGIGAQTNSPKQ